MSRPRYTPEERAARAQWQKRRRRQIAYGRWQPFVDPEPVRRHIAALKRYGLSEVTICRMAGDTTRSSLVTLTHPNSSEYVSKITPKRAEQLLAVRFDLDAIPDGHLLSSVGTRRRVEALAFMGYSAEWIGQQLGVTMQAVRSWVARPKVRAETARAVRDLYDDHWHTPGPTPRAAAMARARGWHGPLAWDDDTLDDPDAQPNLGERDPRDSYRKVHLDDVEFLLDQHAYTWRQLADRLGVTKDALEAAFRRHGRSDLTARLSSNSAGARRAS